MSDKQIHAEIDRVLNANPAYVDDAVADIEPSVINKGGNEDSLCDETHITGCDPRSMSLEWNQVEVLGEHHATVLLADQIVYSLKGDQSERYSLAMSQANRSPADQKKDKLCCVATYAPNSPLEGAGRGGDGNWETHTEKLQWCDENNQPLQCNYQIVCRQKTLPDGQEVIQECRNKRTGQLLDNKGSLFDDLLQRAKCTQVKFVHLAHSESQLGDPTLVNTINALPPTVDFFFKKFLGCSSAGSPAVRCKQLNEIVEILKKKCPGGANTIVGGTGFLKTAAVECFGSLVTWAHACGVSTQLWTDKNGVAHESARVHNSRIAWAYLASKDGFVTCVYQRSNNSSTSDDGKWVPYANYCGSSGLNITGNPNNPPELSCDILNKKGGPFS